MLPWERASTDPEDLKRILRESKKPGPTAGVIAEKLIKERDYKEVKKVTLKERGGHLWFSFLLFYRQGIVPLMKGEMDGYIIVAAVDDNLSDTFRETFPQPGVYKVDIRDKIWDFLHTPSFIKRTIREVRRAREMVGYGKQRGPLENWCRDVLRELKKKRIDVSDIDIKNTIPETLSRG